MPVKNVGYIKNMIKPVAVLISDVHYNIFTLPLADASMRMAIDEANKLYVPLVVAGDLHDTKANLRGECVNAMIKTFKLAKYPIIVLRGNHDQINEKSSEHSLNFLSGLAHIVDSWTYDNQIESVLIPYQHNPQALEDILKKLPKEARIIMHQGITGSNMGDYVRDHSAIDKSLLADFRTISGHYHSRQTIKCGRPRKDAVGLFDYIGNPYTLTFGEANDPEKGFQVLMNDGSLEFVPTNLRKHIKFDILIGSPYDRPKINPGDIVWIRVTGTKEQLSKINRNSLCEQLALTGNVRMELIPLDTKNVLQSSTNILQNSTKESLDIIIDNLLNTSKEQKERLKALWREICE